MKVQGNRFGWGFWVGSILLAVGFLTPGIGALAAGITGLALLLPTLIALGIDKDRAYIAGQAQTQATPPPPPDAPGFGG